MKHTPGPWIVNKAGGKSQVIVDANRSYGRVAVCEPHKTPTLNRPQEELDAIAESNARLIATAPRMYDLVVVLAKGECTCKDGGTAFTCDVCEAKAIVQQVKGVKRGKIV